MSKRADSICLLGHHELDYPRNRSVYEALETAGFRVRLCHSRAPFPWRHFILAWRYLRIHRSVRWVFVTEGGHRLVPCLRLFTALTGRRLVFDPFLSRYNTRIEDRRLYPPRSLQALLCFWQDWSSTRAADALVFDTQEHQQYFFRKYRLRKPFRILPVGVDESLFAPAVPAGAFPTPPSPYPRPGFQVLFYGSYIPLQGVEWIVEATALLREADVHFTLIGRGQTYAQTAARAGALGTDNVTFLPGMPTENLIPYLVHADLCLGIFGDTAKADNVVPNKVVQAAAMGKAIITRDSPAIGRYFQNGLNIALVPAASGQALADRIREMRGDPDGRHRMGEGARRVFLEHFSRAALASILREFLG